MFGKNLETLDMKAMSQDARGALDSVGMSIDEDTLVAGLPVGYMQFAEMAREIDKRGVKLLVFDEPTAVLTESEAAQLLKVMKDIAARGIAIIFITHRLDEVISAADGITILRDGRPVAECRTKDTDVTRLAEMMIGRKGEAAFVTAEPRKVRGGCAGCAEAQPSGGGYAGRDGQATSPSKCAKAKSSASAVWPDRARSAFPTA